MCNLNAADFWIKVLVLDGVLVLACFTLGVPCTCLSWQPVSSMLFNAVPFRLLVVAALKVLLRMCLWVLFQVRRCSVNLMLSELRGRVCFFSGYCLVFMGLYC